MEEISIKMIDPSYKPVHARAYIVLRSVEQQLEQLQQLCKEVVR
jgi:hypothetical protein